MGRWMIADATLIRPRASVCINPSQDRCHGVAIMSGLGGPMSRAIVTG